MTALGDAQTTFKQDFRRVTGHAPFPWQQVLYERFISDRNDNIPATCNLPTGLGKTSVIAVWLIALARGAKVPRRLVYVVNRRTVVDQTTSEVERLRQSMVEKAELCDLREALRKRCPSAHNGGESPLAISTLRGQFADNREWSADPSRPAAICGTVDMIGSRLLFSGYGVGFKAKPLHAGFLGQDVLLVHDEAHLEPAFQTLVEAIRCEQDRCKEFAKFHVMELTATTRNDQGQANEPFGLTKDEETPPAVIPEPPTEPIHHAWRRLRATKSLNLKPADDEKIAEQIADLALERRWLKNEKGENIKDEGGNFKDAKAAVLIFVRTLDDVKKVCDRLANKKDGVPADHVQQLTGTMRGLERDRMADPRRSDASRVFARFLKPPKPDAPESERWKTEPMPGTVYLVCTSAGEVGIDISADHMVCDLSTFESMAQRFGRVNRYGDRADTCIDVVYPTSFGKTDKKTGELKADEIDKRRQKTFELLKKLPALGENQYDASPLALSDLRERPDLPCKIEDAFAPKPTILPATDILFDAWALTSIREKLPGRPPVEPYLHGIAEWQPYETHVAWREEVEIITGELLERYSPADLLDDFPLKPHELLRDATDRKNTGVFAQLGKIARRCPGADIWIVSSQGEVKPAKLQEVAEGDRRRLYDATVILPPSAGGLTPGGTLDGGVDFTKDLKYDVADIHSPSAGIRLRVWSDDDEYELQTGGLRLIRSIEFDSEEDDEKSNPRTWDWYEANTQEGGRTAKRPVLWKTHVDDVVRHAKQIVAGLSLPQEIADAVILAAQLHDHGKKREQFQISLGNRKHPQVMLAKSGRLGARLPEPFRHEFASVLDAQLDEQFNVLSEEMKDLVLHLVATHHGRARPHFPSEEAFDPDRPFSDAEALAVQTPRRFARLQRRYGRWGLAYLESLLRAADWAASAAPSAYADEWEADS
ncbi:MAG: type I-U CRISPR-associated helicase/endonuclease Cas3 [Phycisphaerales bacterium]|nr:type I-U CRISPR-associated helicase/endonuclease Cas3 [Phycisphaerales bacterium]MCI0675396.1 type I-U CRISPR-associated helicase/endonuclease Cas3 [Phycisphaerales bacterium]